MKELVKATSMAIVFFGILSRDIWAGGIETNIFSETGQRIFVKLGEEVPNPYLSLQSKITNRCVSNPQKTCIDFRISAPLGSNNHYTEILNGFLLWESEASLNLDFQYLNTIDFVGIPYSYIPGTNPPEIERDSFGNEIISGNFLISFQPPPEMEFAEGQVSKSMKYIVPDLQNVSGEIRWAGIFLNPAYEPGVDYNLTWVIAAEAGYLLGLAPSATRGSILFPVQTTTSGSPTLASDDKAWARRVYGDPSDSVNFGIVSGEVILGNDGTRLQGAHVELIPKSKIGEFSLNANRSLAKYGAFSRADGQFRIENVDPGEYVLLVESLASIPISSNVWDDWIFALGSDAEFGTEFYDGAERESNNESAGSFSPLLILNAAHLRVVANQETSNVQIITQASVLNPPDLRAAGSSNETLPEISNTVDDRLKKLQEEAAATLPDFSGGCSLSEDAHQPAHWGIIFLILLGALGIRRAKAR